jgi:hypothetical protein
MNNRYVDYDSDYSDDDEYTVKSEDIEKLMEINNEANDNLYKLAHEKMDIEYDIRRNLDEKKEVSDTNSLDKITTLLPHLNIVGADLEKKMIRVNLGIDAEKNKIVAVYMQVLATRIKTLERANATFKRDQVKYNSLTTSIRKSNLDTTELLSLYEIASRHLATAHTRYEKGTSGDDRPMGIELDILRQKLDAHIEKLKDQENEQKLQNKSIIMFNDKTKSIASNEQNILIYQQTIKNGKIVDSIDIDTILANDESMRHSLERYDINMEHIEENQEHIDADTHEFIEDLSIFKIQIKFLLDMQNKDEVKKLYTSSYIKVSEMYPDLALRSVILLEEMRIIDPIFVKDLDAIEFPSVVSQKFSSFSYMIKNIILYRIIIQGVRRPTNTVTEQQIIFRGPGLKKKALTKADVEQIVKKMMNKKGGNIFNNIVDAFSQVGHQEQPRQIREYIEQYGDLVVDKIVLHRTPIDSNINNLMNVISLGQFERNKRDLNIDNMFHLFMTVTLKGKSGETVLEKNQTMSIADFNNRDGSEALESPFHPNINLKAFFRNGIEYLKGEGLEPYNYNGQDNNCQVFLAALLKGNALDDDEEMKFILQDTNYIVGNINGATKNIMTAGIDLAQFTNILIHGASLCPY